MGLSSYIYDLKPQSGDTTAHNELGGAQAFSGTPTLVDLGGGVWAWEFTAASMATITARTITNTGAATGGGATLAITYCVVSPPAAADDRIVSWGSTTTPTEGPSLQIRRGNGGAGFRYPVYRESGFTASFGTEVNEGNSSTTLRTLVVRLRTNYTGTTEGVDQWHSLSGTADAPDATSGGFAGVGTPSFQYLHLAASGGQTIRVHRLTIWPEELVNADCNTVRQGHNAALASDTTPPTMSGSITIGTVTSSSIQMSWSAGSDDTAVTSYEVSSNAGSSYTDVGNVLTYTITGLAAATSYSLRVRAKDAASNVSSPLSATQSTSGGSGVGFDLNLSSYAFKRENDGSLIASTAVTFWAHNASTGALVATVTGLSTNASGIVTTKVTDVALSAATQYRVNYEFTSGEYGTAKLTAS